MTYILVAFFILMISYAYSFPQDLDLDNMFRTITLVLAIIVIINFTSIVYFLTHLL